MKILNIHLGFGGGREASISIDDEGKAHLWETEWMGWLPFIGRFGEINHKELGMMMKEAKDKHVTIRGERQR